MQFEYRNDHGTFSIHENANYLHIKKITELRLDGNNVPSSQVNYFNVNVYHLDNPQNTVAIQFSEDCYMVRVAVLRVSDTEVHFLSMPNTGVIEGRYSQDRDSRDYKFRVIEFGYQKAPESELFCLYKADGSVAFSLAAKPCKVLEFCSIYQEMPSWSGEGDQSPENKYPIDFSQAYLIANFGQTLTVRAGRTFEYWYPIFTFSGSKSDEYKQRYFSKTNNTVSVKFTYTVLEQNNRFGGYKYVYKGGTAQLDYFRIKV